MKVNARIFWIICVFFVAASVAYSIWALLDTGYIEWVGTIALGLVGVLGAFLGFYIGRSYATQGGELPEDRLDGNIDDGDPELGFFSPWSWWPLLLAAGAGLLILGLAVGFWIAFIGVAFTLICIVGWVYEYYRGYFAR
ncbi:cytochrome c oxidase subunit 4 [Microbacterium sp. STN6]|uniref:cytochrome c oxidase subunit 4 n=1 Tax=Microbacterium sp. STN6 TaxID=2995588 RepID=UPI0022610130|nr:cytochrome c oxidase subunit 4 [Microbacterium sp. STN6]MCX7521532.1 cytochrome c oxidase subunit 4 [Microbacterium sp. STN6]